MKIAILGLGVIGTTYAYAFQKAGHQVEHVLRDSKKNTAPKELSVDLLDGRYHSKGENKHDTYEVRVAEANSEYDFIFLSVRHGFVKEAVETLRKIISKAPLFSSVISGILEKRSKSGQEITTIFWLFRQRVVICRRII
ncbi:2-dehydropantoate 2-reductase N-terminal domain-containing protein [Streptococcus sp. 2A/TPW/M5]